MEETTFAQETRNKIEADLSDSVKTAVNKAEELISQLGSQAKVHYQHEIDQVFSDCEQRIFQIASDIQGVINENSSTISNRINQAISEKAKLTASSLIDSLSTEAVINAENLINALPQKIKDQTTSDKLPRVSTIDFVMAKAVAESEEQRLENSDDDSSQISGNQEEAQKQEDLKAAVSQVKQKIKVGHSDSKDKASDKESEVDEIATFFS